MVPKSSWWPVYDTTYPDVQVGWGAYSMRYVYDKDGNLIDKIDEDSSLYDLHAEDIKWPEETKPSEGEGDSGGDTGSGDDVIVVG